MILAVINSYFKTLAEAKEKKLYTLKFNQKKFVNGLTF